MKGFLSPEALARRRLRRTAGVLLDDSSLRGNLTDAQAGELLDWGLAQLQETAEATSRLDDDTAYPLLEEKVAVVRRVMRLISRLMAAAGATSERDIREYIDRLLASLEQLTDQANSPERTAQAVLLDRSQVQLDGDSRFRLLMELLRRDPEDSSDEEA